MKRKKILQCLLIAALILLSIYTLQKQEGIWYFYGHQYSVADFFVVLGRPEHAGIMFILPVIMIVLLNIQRYLSTNYLINFIEVKYYWMHLYKVIVKTACIYTVIFTIIILLYGVLSGNTIINWENQKSIYYGVTGKVYSGPILYIMFLFFLFLFIKVMIISNLFTLLYWKLKNYTLMWCAVLGLTVVEWVVKNLKIFNNVFTITYKNFGQNNYIILKICIAFAILLLLYRFNVAMLNKKEFMTSEI